MRLAHVVGVRVLSVWGSPQLAAAGLAQLEGADIHRR